jgi:hypothetical protein
MNKIDKNSTLRTLLDQNLDYPKKEKDRNFDKGGRSFYFFDFDDNILNLTTQIYLFHKETRKEKIISSTDLADEGENIGKTGRYADYDFNFNDDIGSFRNFRDDNITSFQKFLGRKQTFENDVQLAINSSPNAWMGPSWEYFRYACFNQRPVSIITARGQSPETIKKGIKTLVKLKKLPCEPNYLCIYPLANKDTRMLFGDPNFTVSSAEMKKLAIYRSVEMAIYKYGKNPYHRFGMSDDSPKNLELITKAMFKLKKKYPQMSFFLIDTHKGKMSKKEVLDGHLKETELEDVTVSNDQ